jgi:hypothetical protein
MSAYVLQGHVEVDKITLETPVEFRRQVSAEVSGSVCNDMYGKSKLQH